MRSTFHWLLIFTAAAAAACSSDTAPNDGNGGNGGNGAAGTVTVGNIFFRSGHNGTQNPAVDTVAAGTTVTWTWTGTGSQPHSVRSQGDTQLHQQRHSDRQRHDVYSCFHYARHVPLRLCRPR